MVSYYYHVMEKQTRFELVKQALIQRLDTKESLRFLKKNGHSISERTLRRDKQDIREYYGNNLSDLIKVENVENIHQDFYAFQEIEKRCWQLLQDEKTSTDEKIRLFECIKKTIKEKHHFHRKIPRGLRNDWNKPSENRLLIPKEHASQKANLLEEELN